MAEKTIYDSFKRGKVDKIWMTKKEAAYIEKTDPEFYKNCIKPNLIGYLR